MNQKIKYKKVFKTIKDLISKFGNLKIEREDCRKRYLFIKIVNIIYPTEDFDIELDQNGEMTISNLEDSTNIFQFISEGESYKIIKTMLKRINKIDDAYIKEISIQREEIADFYEANSYIGD